MRKGVYKLRESTIFVKCRKQDSACVKKAIPIAKEEFLKEVGKPDADLEFEVVVRFDSQTETSNQVMDDFLSDTYVQGDHMMPMCVCHVVAFVSDQ